MRAAFSFSGATRHGLIALAEGLVVAGIIAALLFALSPIYAPARLISGTDQTYAAKGGNGGGSGGGGSTAVTPSIDLVQPMAAAATTGWPALRQQVDFATVFPSNVRNPRVEVLCYQPTDPSGYAMYVDGKGYLVYAEARGATENQYDYMGEWPFILGSGMSAWLLNGGPADCVANLFYFGKSSGSETYEWLASRSFAAGG